MNRNPLIGKTVTTLYMTTDNKALRFVLADGTEIVAKTDADCCSETWIEHISLPAGGFPATVLEANDTGGLPDSDDGCMQYYGFELKTNKGHMVLDYRNQSNGYYGGSLSWPGDHFYGGVYCQNVPNDDWKLVTEDF